MTSQPMGQLLTSKSQVLLLLLPPVPASCDFSTLDYYSCPNHRCYCCSCLQFLPPMTSQPWATTHIQITGVIAAPASSPASCDFSTHGPATHVQITGGNSMLMEAEGPMFLPDPQPLRSSCSLVPTPCKPPLRPWVLTVTLDPTPPLSHHSQGVTNYEIHFTSTGHCVSAHWTGDTLIQVPRSIASTSSSDLKSCLICNKYCNHEECAIGATPRTS